MKTTKDASLCTVCGGWLGSESNDHDHLDEAAPEDFFSDWMAAQGVVSGPSGYKPKSR